MGHLGSSAWPQTFSTPRKLVSICVATILNGHQPLVSHPQAMFSSWVLQAPLKGCTLGACYRLGPGYSLRLEQGLKGEDLLFFILFLWPLKME